MWETIPSPGLLLQALAPVFCAPTMGTNTEILLGWVMCLGRHTGYRVFEAIDASRVASRASRHPYESLLQFLQSLCLDCRKIGARTLCFNRSQAASEGHIDFDCR